MATVRPFLGLRFSNAKERLGEHVAPPYDVLSEEQRDAYAAKSEHNIVRLTLPESHPDDRSKFVKYARSSERLEAWRREGALVREDEPSFYRYTQTFSLPGQEEPVVRTSLVGLIKLEPYENGIVLPHEQTFPKHKEDRLRVLEATRSHLECIFGLYEDDERAVHHLVLAAEAEFAGEDTDPDGVHHRFERISDPGVIETISGSLESSKVWIADGHHRYETALAFREKQPSGDSPIPEDFMLMALCSLSDPGLVLLPTHRILKKLPVTPEELRTRLSSDFAIEDCRNTDLMPRIEEVGAVGQKRAFGVALPGGAGIVAVCDDVKELARKTGDSGSTAVGSLDVTILHEYIFHHLLGLEGHDFFGYTRDVQEAIDAVEAGAPAAFLMNPPTTNDMRQVALGGERMPQKSTYYYPKLLSGLVMWSLKDFQE